jgi:putative pyruvate formate lyase activating enzyme
MNHTTREILSHYFDILDGEDTAKYLQCKHIPVDFKSHDTTDELWKKHNSVLQNIKAYDTEPEQSLLDLKIELADRIFKECVFCERRCKVDRRSKPGNCGVMESRVTSEFLHLGEESVLIPSYTIFFSGCTFHCVYCQNWDISQRICGWYVEPKTLSHAIRDRRNGGAINVNWVGGDPTSNLLYILKVLKELDVNIPQVWNSNMYCSTETMSLLKGVIDVYLTDFKYGNDSCAKRLSKVDNYTHVVKRNHKIAYDQGEIILRHLVLPNHTSCCSEPVLQWVHKNIPDVAVNVMAQYRPEYHARRYDDISHPLSMKEYRKVKDFAENLKMHLI